MSDSRNLLYAQQKVADTIKEKFGWITSELLFVDALIAALHQACSEDEFRLLQYYIQNKDAPREPGERFWVCGTKELDNLDLDETNMFEPWETTSTK
jgi:hypothetical protein